MATSPTLQGPGGPLVFQSVKRRRHCAECRGGPLSLLVLEGGLPRCLDCADLGHLVFLARGDTALTRRAREGSTLYAVVVRFNRRQGRYERQGLLVEEDALARAEERCLADAEVRARRRARDAKRREAEDVRFTAAFAEEIRRLFPGCPPDRARAIAAHASVRGSGRVGRSAAGRALSETAMTAAVAAAVRHTDTPYDGLLMTGVPRQEARRRIGPAVEATLRAWRAGTATDTGAGIGAGMGTDIGMATGTATGMAGDTGSEAAV
ncbi:DUF2293 domain-containing protein [Streptomyces sp. PSKA54]|uniref:DUF2293 domain-containing protein n=1 Tax=Streptomyces himalayensis subsp. aureolus TaxID=2758039 RepID=A0A7W2HDW2_9ACTN|nr:DUF2293 domain-containing protein [Streptomyces himalayensis]MBA4859994.1 DUF2293 domain-containing protein [Streptomyces himalayensis subsp. aureolus]